MQASTLWQWSHQWQACVWMWRAWKGGWRDSCWPQLSQNCMLSGKVEGATFGHSLCCDLTCESNKLKSNKHIVTCCHKVNQQNHWDQQKLPQCKLQMPVQTLHWSFEECTHSFRGKIEEEGARAKMLTQNSLGPNQHTHINWKDVHWCDWFNPFRMLSFLCCHWHHQESACCKKRVTTIILHCMFDCLHFMIWCQICFGHGEK